MNPYQIHDQLVFTIRAASTIAEQLQSHRGAYLSRFYLRVRLAYLRSQVGTLCRRLRPSSTAASAS